MSVRMEFIYVILYVNCVRNRLLILVSARQHQERSPALCSEPADSTELLAVIVPDNCHRELVETQNRGRLPLPPGADSRASHRNGFDRRR